MFRPFTHPVACCCLLFGVVAQSLKPVKGLSQQHLTFLLFRDRRSVAQEPWIPLHSSSNIFGAKMAAECNFTKSNGLYHSHDVLQVHRKVVASVCTCCPSCAETEEGQLSRDVRYSEADKEDLLSYALESICKLETKKNAFKCHLAHLVNGFLTEFETARQNERYSQRKHLHGSYNTKWKL